MKLRTRLAVTLGLATLVLLGLLGWAQTQWHSRLRVEALAEATVHRMQSGGRERCETNPESWPWERGRRAKGDRRDRHPREGLSREPHGSRRHRRLPPESDFFAYDAGLNSKNPKSPPFPPHLAQQLNAGHDVAVGDMKPGQPTEVAVAMPWDDGPCAVVLLRTSAPPAWLSLATLLPAVLMSLGVIAVTLLAAGPIVGRVRRLTEDVARMGSAEETSIRHEGHDEIAELGRAFEKSRSTIQMQLRSLQERESALRNYIAHTTHDVMLPLSVLQGHLAQTQQRIEGGEALTPSDLSPIMEETHYLGSMLHNLNAAARLEAGPGLPHEDDIDLNRLVERVVDRHRPIAGRKRVSLEVAVPEQPITFRGDLTLLEQAFSNVVHNAVRYNKEGGHVAIALHGTDRQWKLEVIDDGPGVAPGDRTRVLESAFRGSEARTRHPHGMGLGLHIAHDVATRHQLALELHETQGGGLTVSFSHAPVRRT